MPDGGTDEKSSQIKLPYAYVPCTVFHPLERTFVTVRQQVNVRSTEPKSNSQSISQSLQSMFMDVIQVD